ncbi:phage portal protein [Paraburkholderia phosphatilytica]|uniref:phage portal protein n=1 Tax=Paraburkholderia phosphatilytica TaxID=2282883 RepID=UPI000E48FCA9|nr:phage portal protein [Paraburkholderia phosphatilytica]
MWRALKETKNQDKDLPQRAFDIQCLNEVLDGTLYDDLEHPFHCETDSTKAYVTLRQRRPSVRSNLCALVVEHTASLLFSEEHFPTIESDDDGVGDALQAIAQDKQIAALMDTAVIAGSVGSVAIRMRVLSNRLYFDVLQTQFLTPTWKANQPDVLQSVREQYKVKGEVLAEGGYAIPDTDMQADFWFRRDWTESQEIWYAPWRANGKKSYSAPGKVDGKRTVGHTLGFVPIIWAQNLAKPGGNGIDGRCTFDKAIETMLEIDYLLSQGGRSMKYALDPTLVVKAPQTSNGELVKGAGEALVVSEKGDAKLLEISGGGTEALIEFCKCLRQTALEAINGNKADSDKLAAATSGRAMELMNMALIQLCARLRITYGAGALLSLFRMIAKVSQTGKLVDSNGERIEPIKLTKPLKLRWPEFYAPTWADKTNEAGALSTLTQGGILSKETATRSIAQEYDVAADEELARTKADADVQQQNAVALKAAAPKPVPDNSGT